MTKQPNKTKRERRSIRNICRHSDTHTYVYRGMSKYFKKGGIWREMGRQIFRGAECRKNDLT